MPDRAWRFTIPPEGRASVAQLLRERSALKIPHKIIGKLIADHLMQFPRSPFTKSVIEFLQSCLGNSGDRMLASKLLQSVIGELLDYHIIAEPESPVTQCVFEVLDQNLYNPSDRRLFSRIPATNEAALRRLLTRAMNETSDNSSQRGSSPGDGHHGVRSSPIRS